MIAAWFVYFYNFENVYYYVKHFSSWPQWIPLESNLCLKPKQIKHFPTLFLFSSTSLPYGISRFRIYVYIAYVYIAYNYSSFIHFSSHSHIQIYGSPMLIQQNAATVIATYLETLLKIFIAVLSWGFGSMAIHFYVLTLIDFSVSLKIIFLLSQSSRCAGILSKLFYFIIVEMIRIFFFFFANSEL